MVNILHSFPDIPDRGLCLSDPEADFVHTCLEHDDMVTPFEVNKEVTPSPALRSFDVEIVVHDMPMRDMGNADLPFSACTNEEVRGFFHVLDNDDMAADIIVDKCYDCCPGKCSEEVQFGVDWSILTPFSSYT